jgi:hypothetical protein
VRRDKGHEEAYQALGYEERNGTPPVEELLAGRVDIGDVIRNGIDPPEELIERVILAHKVHVVYSAAGKGKTFFMLWVALQVIEKGHPVLIFDKENGAHTIAERIEQMGADPDAVTKLLYYFPDYPLTPEVYRAMLSAIEPALVIFDSWIAFLAADDLDENVSNDIATWAVNYTQPARQRGIAVLLLDHVPKEGVSARGSGRKRDEVDVMWSLNNPQPFDRDTLGQITLILDKDREGWLQRSVGFTVGAGIDGFIFRRSDGFIEETGADGLTGTERRVLETLSNLGIGGATGGEWKKQATHGPDSVSTASYYRAKSKLEEARLVEKRENHYYATTTLNTVSNLVRHMPHGETPRETPDGQSGARENPIDKGSLKDSQGVSVVSQASGETTPETSRGSWKEHSLDCDCDDCQYGEL